MSTDPVKLGETYTDSITGVKGIAVSRHEYLYGCVRVCLEWGKDGTAHNEHFDEQRLTTKPSATSGGPQTIPAPRKD